MSEPFKKTMVNGVFALLGVIAGGAMTGWSQVNLAKQKFNSDLVLKALESNSPDERLESLKFLVETNLIQDSSMQEAVKEYAKTKEGNPSKIPQVSMASPLDDSSKSKLANAKEQEGYKLLIDGNFEHAQQAFESAEAAINGYHNVFELARLLRERRESLKDQNAKKEVYKTIVDQYWGYASSEQLKKLRELAL